MEQIRHALPLNMAMSKEDSDEADEAREKLVEGDSLFGERVPPDLWRKMLAEGDG